MHTLQFLYPKLLKNRIHLFEIRFTEHGSKLMVFRSGNYLSIRFEIALQDLKDRARDERRRDLRSPN